MIIVIAIMAILVGVLAPNLLRYIERAKIASDTQLADTIMTVFTVTFMDPEVIQPTDGYWAEYGHDFNLTTNAGRMIGSGVLPDPCLMDADGNDTPFGKAIAEGLGYPDVATMIGPDGLISEIRYDPEASIGLQCSPNYDNITIFIYSDKYGSYVNSYWDW